MLRLYSGSGSQEIDLQGKAIPDDQWAKYKQLAVKMLNARNAGEAARFLDETPFEVHAGINFFGDEFCVLYASVDFDTYIALGETTSSPETNYVTTKIVSTLNELLSVYIRFVAVDLATNDCENKCHRWLRCCLDSGVFLFRARENRRAIFLAQTSSPAFARSSRDSM